MVRVIIRTRFSFLGRSVWQSEASQDPALLFSDERLAARFAMFEAMTVPSLMAQDDDDFHWDVLSSEQMPARWQRRLREMVLDRFKGRAEVRFEPPAKAGRYFRNYQARRLDGDGAVPLGAQVVLDDDDALATDYVARLRNAGAEAAPELGEAGYTYLSFPLGFWVLFGKNLRTAPRVVKMRERCVNLGLAVLGPANFAQNPYLTAHRVLHRRHPVQFLCGARPMYLRAVHGQNDLFPRGRTGLCKCRNCPRICSRGSRRCARLW